MVKKSICIITTIDKTITSFIIPVARELQGRGYSITFISSMQDSFIEKNKQEFNLINLVKECYTLTRQIDAMEKVLID